MEHGKKVGSGEEWTEAWKRLFSKTVVLVSHHNSTYLLRPCNPGLHKYSVRGMPDSDSSKGSTVFMLNWETNDGPRVTLMLRGCWPSDRQILAKCFYHKTLLPSRKHVLPWQQCLTFVLAWIYLEANCSVKDVILTAGYLWLTCAPVCCYLQVWQGKRSVLKASFWRQPVGKWSVLHIASQGKRLGLFGAGSTFRNAKSINAL